MTWLSTVALRKKARNDTKTRAAWTTGRPTSQQQADLSQQLSAASPTQQPYIVESSDDLGQLRNQDCFYEHLLSFVRRSLPAWSGVSLIKGRSGPVLASKLPLVPDCLS